MFVLLGIARAAVCISFVCCASLPYMSIGARDVFPRGLLDVCENRLLDLIEEFLGRDRERACDLHGNLSAVSAARRKPQARRAFPIARTLPPEALRRGRDLQSRRGRRRGQRARSRRGAARRHTHAPEARASSGAARLSRSRCHPSCSR